VHTTSAKHLQYNTRKNTITAILVIAAGHRRQCHSGNLLQARLGSSCSRYKKANRRASSTKLLSINVASYPPDTYSTGVHNIT
jgi:hypothetical protein